MSFESRLKGLQYHLSQPSPIIICGTGYCVENKKKAKTKTHPKTKILPILNGRNKKPNIANRRLNKSNYRK